MTEIEVSGGAGPIKAGFRFHHGVPVEELEVCKPKIIPVVKLIRTQKWIVHLLDNGEIRQFKIG